MTEELISKVDPYIELNKEGLYEIKSKEILQELITTNELKLVERQISIANENIIHVINNDIGNTIIDGDKVSYSIKDFEILPSDGEYQTMAAGVTKVDYYWWGLKVYLSKYALQGASAVGIGMAGYIARLLKVPHPLGLAIAGALGGGAWLVGQISHGIVMRINYAPPPFPFLVTKIEYQ